MKVSKVIVAAFCMLLFIGNIKGSDIENSVASVDEQTKIQQYIMENEADIQTAILHLSGKQVSEQVIEKAASQQMYRLYHLEVDQLAQQETLSSMISQNYDIVTFFDEEHKGTFEVDKESVTLLGIEHETNPSWLTPEKVQESVQKQFTAQEMKDVLFVKSDKSHMEFALLIEQSNQEWVIPYAANFEVDNFENGKIYAYKDFVDIYHQFANVEGSTVARSTLPYVVVGMLILASGGYLLWKRKKGKSRG